MWGPMKMTGNGTKKYGVRLKNPADIKRIIQRVMSDIFREGSQVENAGKINQLCQTWLRAHQIELEIGEWKEIKGRLERVEQVQSFSNRQKALDFRKSMSELKQITEAI